MALTAPCEIPVMTNDPSLDIPALGARIRECDNRFSGLRGFYKDLREAPAKDSGDFLNRWLGV